MPSPPNETPLGMFYGDQGGPAATPPTASSAKNCPFLDPEENAFCTLDGALCPFVGFSYNKCKKYTNNLSKGMLGNQQVNFTPTSKPPRHESLTEAAKKRGSRLLEAKVPPEVDKIIDARIAANQAFADAISQDNKAYWDSTDAEIDAAEAEAAKKGIKPITKKGKKPKGRSKGESTKPRRGSSKVVDPATARKNLAKETETSTGPDLHAGDVKPLTPAELEPYKNTFLYQVASNWAKSLKKAGGRRRKPEPEDIVILTSIINNNGVEQHSSVEKLQKERASQAAVIAAVMKHDGNVEDYFARSTAAGVATATNILAGADVSTNRLERKAAAETKQKYGDQTVSMFTKENNPQRGKASGGPRPVVAAETPDPHGAPEITPGLGTEEVPPNQKIIDRYQRLLGKKPIRNRVNPDTPEAPGVEPEAAAPKPKKTSTRRVSQTKAPFSFTLDPDDEEPSVATDDQPGLPRYAAQKGTAMNVPQFKSFLETLKDLPEKDLKLIFAGYSHEGKSMSQAFSDIQKHAERLGKTKNYVDIAKMRSYLLTQKEDLDKLRRQDALRRQALASNLQLLKDVNIGDRVATDIALRRMGQSPEATGKVAKIMNKVADRLYTVKTANLNIGDQTIQSFIKELTIPTFNRSDYEVMRISQQMGMAAMQKTHQYGRRYGKWNTWNLFLRSVVMPAILTLIPGGIGIPLIKPLMSWWPQELFDQFYTSYVDKPLPKLQAGPQRTTMMSSKDTKFLASQKMANQTTHDRIMRGFEQDNILPPDRAVLHTRWFPTTKVPWTKVRHKELTARYNATKAERLPKATKHSFLRR